MTKAQAIKLAESKFWEPMTFRERATFQLFEENRRLCMPFDVFHEAVEKTLNRPVWTHEFGLNWEGLKAELIGEKPAPTMDPSRETNRDRKLGAWLTPQNGCRREP